MILLRELFKAFVADDFNWEHEKIANMPVLGIETDSRALRAGEVFLAVGGLATVSGGAKSPHALHFAQAAIQAGALAIAYESDLESRQVLENLQNKNNFLKNISLIPIENLRQRQGEIAAKFLQNQNIKPISVTGITGTDGKTSCAWLLAQAQSLLGQKTAYLGTLGYGFTDQTLGRATHTTPEGLAVQRWLAAFALQGAQSAAMEISSHALDQGRARGTTIDVAAITNITRDHLDYHGDLTHYYASKARLFSDFQAHTHIINADNLGVQSALSQYFSQEKLNYSYLKQIIYYGFNLKNQNNFPENINKKYLCAQNFIADIHGINFEVIWENQTYLITSQLLGQFNAENLLLVIASLLARDFEMKDIVAICPKLRTVPGRMEAWQARGGLMIVDYAHTPGGLAAAVRAARAHCQGELTVVFGCGGDRDRGKRPLMAAEAANVADRLIFTDDNPRRENPHDIVADMLAGLPENAANYQVIHARETAIQTAFHQMQAGDVVLIAGKGHETTQTYGTDVRAFSDRNVVAGLAAG